MPEIKGTEMGRIMYRTACNAGMLRAAGVSKTGWVSNAGILLSVMLCRLRASLPARSLLPSRSLLHARTMSAPTLAATGRENIPAEPAAKVQRTEGPAADTMEALRVRRLNEHALLPKRGSSGAAGYDLARQGLQKATFESQRFAGVAVAQAGAQRQLAPPPPQQFVAFQMAACATAAHLLQAPLCSPSFSAALPTPRTQPPNCPPPPRSCEDAEVPARGRAVVKTGLQIACPPGTYARVAPRSGLAVKHFIDTGAGVVDEDYRGEVGVVLFNHSDTAFQGEAPGQAATGRNSFSSASLLAKSPLGGAGCGSLAPLPHAHPSLLPQAGPPSLPCSSRAFACSQARRPSGAAYPGAYCHPRGAGGSVPGRHAAGRRRLRLHRRRQLRAASWAPAQPMWLRFGPALAGASLPGECRPAGGGSTCAV